MWRVRVAIAAEEEDVEGAQDDAIPADGTRISATIVQKLLQFGIPEELLERRQEGFTCYVNEHRNEIPKLVAALIPSPAEVRVLSPLGCETSDLVYAKRVIQEELREAITWLQWAAFGKEPKAAFATVQNEIGGARGVCGAVWGSSDIAYRCHTCEHDVTCAICVPCFHAGDHSTHDYSMIHTTGGCCDCGDATAWKEAGFCSRHRGPGQVPPLPDSLVSSVKPVLQALLREWQERLEAALLVALGKPRKWSAMTAEEKIASQFSLSLVELLLDFCNCSESMLSFAAECASNEELGLLDTLMTAECFLPTQVDGKLHELLYKLLGDPNFKYRFAQAFIRHYPKFLHDSLFDTTSGTVRMRDHSILGGFSVQIFTVPTLTPRLVLESKLLDLLFSILKDLFMSCVGRDGRFMVSKAPIQDRAYFRAVEDVRYVMSHLKVAQYVVHVRPDLCKMWLQFLAFIQGMHAQRRIISIHIEEENEDWFSAFLLEARIATIHPLFVVDLSTDGSLNSQEEQVTADEQQQQQQSLSKIYNVEGVNLSGALVWLIAEAVEILGAWLALDAARELAKPTKPSTEAALGILRWRMQPGRRITNLLERSPPSLDSDEKEAMDIDDTPTTSNEAVESGDREWWMGSEEVACSDSILLTSGGWPVVDFDVSKQDVSFHIPLHRMLALLLLKALEEYELQMNKSNATCDKRSSAGFLLGLLPEKFRVPGFLALLVEHPLRLQVLCAQVQGGMWRRNGQTILGVADIYRSVQWCEESLELDIFVLQCCAAMSPAEEFAGRLLSCFGLSDYFSLFLWRPNEYEPFLAQELLVLIIRIVSERGFCGLSLEESLRRELVQRLAIGDAAHSSLLNALPPRLHDNKHLQETLDAVATYRKPYGMQQGKYVLREQCWKELDLYHPRWTPRELQSAEERYLRVCKTSALFSQPPKWRKPFLPLQNIAQVALSARVHDVLRSVFFHAAFSSNPAESRSPENLLFTALHLLSLGLDICAAFPSSATINKEKSMECEMGESSSGFEPSSPPQNLTQQRPPLLSQATEFVYVGEPDGTLMAERQSTISLLVLLMRKYMASEGAQLIVSEVTQCNVGAFIKNLLHRFAELDRGCMYAIESLAPEILHRLLADQSKGKAQEGDELQTELSDIERKKAVARERQAAMLAKMMAAQDKFMASMENTEQTEQAETKKSMSKTEGKRPRESDVNAESTSPLCALCRDRDSTSPLCILTLVQRSRLLALAEKPTPSWDKKLKDAIVEAPIEKEPGHARRQAENIIFELRHWLEGANAERNNESARVGLPVILALEAESGGGNEEGESMTSSSTATTAEVSWWESNHLAVRGANSEDNSSHGIVQVLSEYVTAISRVQSETQQNVEAAARESSSTPRARRLTTRNSGAMSGGGLSDLYGLHLSACGHAAHQDCLDRYYSSLLQRFYSRSLFEGVQIVDPDMGEFLCPVCRRLSNSFLPVLEDYSARLSWRTAESEAFEGLRLDQARSLLCNAEDLMSKAGFRKAVSKKLPDGIKGVLDVLATRLGALIHPEKDHLSLLVDSRNCQGLFLWDLLRYTTLSVELAARTKNSLLGLLDAANRLIVLEESANASRGSILPLLFVAAKASVSQNRPIVLLRARGMQLLVSSVCHGISRDILPDKSPKGNLQPIVQFLEKGQNSVDVQFWKRAADPVLAHDPFSSLIWSLFCLPLPIPSDRGPFTALVHMFYLVCVVQIIGHCGASSQLDPKIQKFMRAVYVTLQSTTTVAQEDIYRSQTTIDSIRRFTLPYLRRCVLLQTVYSYSECAVPVAGPNSWDISNVHSLLSAAASSTATTTTAAATSSAAAKQRQSADNDDAFQLKEVEEYERRFRIPPLQLILNDEAVHSQVMTWCKHLEDCVRPFLNIPLPVTASPFKLMQLPHLFQDLLQRYVKERCPVCNKVPERPALCLLCSALCCGSGASGCCSVNLQSECYRHAMSCGGGVGVYLMLKKTNVLLVRRERQAMWPSPYLDVYGEEDHEMRRGKPLFLSEERYAALTTMVATHGLDYSSTLLSHTARDITF